MSAPYREAAPDLGPLVRTHRDDRDGCLLVALAIPGVLVAVVFVVTANGWGLAAETLAVLAGVWALRRPGRLRPGVIELHEKGIVLRLGDTTTAIPFDDVRSITSKATRSVRSGVRTEHHRVESREGRHIEFGTGWRLPRDLLAVIEGATLPRLRTEALRAFDDGETVRFGPFALADDGLRCDDLPLLPWKDVVRVTVEDGRIEVWKADVWEKKGKSYAARGVSLVPNFRILLEMCDLAIEREAGERGAA